MAEEKLTIIEVNNITIEILMLKQQTAQNIIEIGNRLIKVKESLGHGDWLPWLGKEVDFKATTASKFMKVAREFSNFQTCESLSQSKIFALLDLPSEEREAFISQPQTMPSGEVKKVDEMTTRELQEAIKAQKAAEKKAEDAKQKTIVAEEKAKELEKTLKAERQQAKLDIEKLNGLIQTAKSNGDSSEKVKQLEDDLEAAQQEVQELTDRINEPITIEPVVVEKIPEGVELELESLKQKNIALEKQVSQSNDSVIKYKVYFQDVAAGFKNLLAALAEIEEKDPDNHEKFKNATSGFLEKMLGSL